MMALTVERQADLHLESLIFIHPECFFLTYFRRAAVCVCVGSIQIFRLAALISLCFSLQGFHCADDLTTPRIQRGSYNHFLMNYGDKKRRLDSPLAAPSLLGCKTKHERPNE